MKSKRNIYFKKIVALVIFLLVGTFIFSLFNLKIGATEVILNNAQAIINYCNNYGAGNANDIITIEITQTSDGIIDLTDSSFNGIGTSSNPFAGTIKFSSAAGSIKKFLLNKALFKYISTDAEIIDSSNGKATNIELQRGENSDTYVFAEYVMAGTNKANWKIDYATTIDDNSTAGLIGSIDTGAKVDLYLTTKKFVGEDEGGNQVTVDTLRVNSAKNVGFVCANLGSSAELTIKSFVTNGMSYYVTSTYGVSGGFVGYMDANSKFIFDDTTETFEARFNVNSNNNNAGGIAGEVKSGAQIILNAEYTSKDNVEGKTNVGGIIGLAEDGVTIDLNDSYELHSAASIKSTNGNAGGLVGYGTNTNLDIATGKTVTSNGNIESKNTSGAGGIYGQFDSTSTDKTFVLNQIKLNTTLKTGISGGIFGILNSTDNNITIDGGYSVTADNKDVAIDKQVKYDNSSTGGGLIGKYTNTKLEKTLYIENNKININSGSSGAYTAGLIGTIGNGDSYPTYVKIENNAVKSSSNISAGLIGYINNDGHFIDICGICAVGGTNTYEAGLISNSETGVVRLQGITDFNGNYISGAPKISGGQIAKTHNNTLIYALGNGSDSGWSYRRTSSDRKNDLGDWGEVVRLVGNSIPESDIFTINMTNHTCTLKPRVLNISNETHFILTALNIQFNKGVDIGALCFEDKTNKDTVILGSDLTLEDNINLSGTGILGFTRDISSGNNVFDDITYTGSFDGKDHTITLAIGEDYGSENSSTDYTNGKGSGVLFNRKYEGLFTILDNAEIKNLKVGGYINLINTVDKNASGEKQVGALGAVATNAITLNKVELSHSTNIFVMSSNDTDGYTYICGGAIGQLKGNKTVNISNCKFNSSFHDIRRANVRNYYAGGIIGYVSSTSNDLNINFDTIELGAQYDNKTTFQGVTSEKINKENYGGLVGYIKGTSNIEYRTVSIKDLTISDNFLINSKNYTADIETPGLLGSVWLDTKVTIGTNGSSTGGITIGTTDGTGATLNEEGTCGNLGALVYKGTGYWRVNHIDVQNLNISSTNGGSFGFIANQTTDGTQSAMYLELINTGTQYNIGRTSITGAFSTFDEIVAYSKFSGKNIVENGESIISVTTTDGQPIVMTNPKSTCNTYQNKTAYGITNSKVNGNTRYYYNLDTIRIKPSTSDGEKLLLWSLNKYAGACYIQQYFPLSLSYPGALSGDFNMIGLSYYPVNSSVNISDGSSIKFYNEEIELSESGTGNSDSIVRSTRENTTQHYLMHTGILYNAPNISVEGLVVQGNVGRVDGKSGFIVHNKLAGGDSVTQSTMSKIVLDGCYISNYSTSCSPLLINSIGKNAELTTTDVKTISNSIFTSIISDNKYAATSLIGTVGGATAENITLRFSKMVLDSRKSSDSNSDLDTAYGTTRTIFEKATLLDSFVYNNNGYGEYNFTYDEDWGSTLHQVTYGYEITASLEYQSTDVITGSTTKSKEQHYYGDTRFTRPSGSNFNSYYDFREDNHYLPYVAIRDLANSQHEIKVNLMDAALIYGCGQYNDPYIINESDVFVAVANIINGTISNGLEIKLPVGLGSAGANVMWHDSNDVDDTFIYNQTNSKFECTGQTSLSAVDVRKYLAGAYYSLGDNITLPNEYISISTIATYENLDDDIFTFHGVIIGNNVTIVNNSSNPLISVANGCVLKGFTMDVCSTISYDEQSKNTTFTNTSTSGKTYGALIGHVLGGDNIIDNVSVSFEHAKFSITGQAFNRLVPVGGYIGCVVNGFVIFRNYESGVSGITNTKCSKINDESYVYFNPIIGRVLDGAVFNETTTAYNRESTLINNGIINNGTKNYGIPDLNSNDNSKLEVTLVDGKYYINVPNSQALYILSCIINSGAGSASEYNKNNSKYGANAMTRSANYDEVGTSASDTGDYSKVSSNDKMSQTNASYLILHYTSPVVTNYYARCICSKTIEKITLSKTTYYLGKGYRGLGNLDDGIRLTFKHLDGKEAIIDLDMYLVEYDSDNENYPSKNTSGFGFINELFQNSASEDNSIHDISIKGHVYYDVMNLTQGRSIYYQYDNIVDGVKKDFYKAVGGVVGFCNGDNDIYLKDIIFGDINVEGPRFAGGLIGYKINKNKTINIVNCKSENSNGITSSAGQFAGGLIGYVTEGVVNISDSQNNSINIKQITNKVCFKSKIKINGEFQDVGAGGIIGKTSANTTISNINLVGIINSNFDPNVEQLSWHTESKCVIGGMFGVITNTTTINNAMLTNVLIRGGFAGGIAGGIYGGTITVNGFTYEGNNNIIGSGYNENNKKNKSPGTIAALRSAGGLIGRTATSNILLNDISISNATIISTYRQKTNVGSDTFYYEYETGSADDKANSGDLSTAGGLIGYVHATGNNNKYNVENIYLCNVNVFSLYDKTSTNHRTQYGPYEDTKDGFVGTGGIIGSINPAITFTGNNILLDSVNVNHYNYSIATDKISNEHATGMICGNYKNNSTTFKIVGISIKRSNNQSTIPYAGQGKNGSVEKLYINSNTYVVFADYNNLSAVLGESSPNKTNPTIITPHDKDAASPYVLINPAVYIDDTHILTGDGMATSVSNLAINNIDKVYYTKAGTNIDTFNNKYLSTKLSTFNTEQGTDFSNNFAVLIVDDMSKINTTEMINSYIRSLTNTDFNYVQDISKIFAVDLYRLVYNERSGIFELSADSSNLKRTTGTASKYYFYMESNGADTSGTMFSLIDVKYFDPYATSTVAYHLYIPVIVRKLLNYKFEIATASGTNYERAWYTTNSRFGKPLMENLGTAVTLYFRYTYLRTHDEWQAAIDSGDNLLDNYDKILTFATSSADGIPNNTLLVLVDPNTNITYYAYYSDVYNDANGGYLNLSAFNQTLGSNSQNTAFSPIRFNDMLDISFAENNNGKFVIVEEATDEDTANATVKATKVNENGTKIIKYFRLLDENDPDSVTKYSLTVNDENDETSGFVDTKESYYISFFTDFTDSPDDSDDNVIYHHMAGCKDSLASDSFNYPSRIQNKTDTKRAVQLYLGNIFEQENLSVATTNSIQEMSITNRALGVNLGVVVKINDDVKTAVSGALGNDSGIEIYQTYILNLLKMNAGNDIKIIEGNPTIAGTYTISSVNTSVSNINGNYGTINNLGSHAEFINGVALNNYLINGGGANITSTITLTYDGDGNISAQFPRKSNPSNTTIGVLVGASSNMSFDSQRASSSKITLSGNDVNNRLYYYKENAKNAILYYNVISRDVTINDHTNLGLNPLDSNDPTRVEINTMGIYDISPIITEAADYEYIKCTVQLTCRQDDYSSYLDIDDYLEDFYLNSIPSGSQTGNKYEFVYQKANDLDTRIQIPITFTVVTGQDFESLSHFYSNYRVTLTVELVKNSDGTNGLAESKDSSYIIYTNARIIPDFID